LIPGLQAVDGGEHLLDVVPQVDRFYLSVVRLPGDL